MLESTGTIYQEGLSGFSRCPVNRLHNGGVRCVRGVLLCSHTRSHGDYKELTFVFNGLLEVLNNLKDLLLGF